MLIEQLTQYIFCRTTCTILEVLLIVPLMHITLKENGPLTLHGKESLLLEKTSLHFPGKCHVLKKRFF